MGRASRAPIRVGPSRRRLVAKAGRFPDNGIKGIGRLELELMPNNAHLTCPQCGSYKMGVSIGAFDKSLTRVGCGCGWESFIDIELLPTDFSGSCPKCLHNEFVIMKLSDQMGCGCLKCSWQHIYSFPQSNIIIPGVRIK